MKIMYYICQQLNNRTDTKNNNRYWSDHHAYTQNIRPSTQDNHENSHNHSKLNDLLGFLDCRIESMIATRIVSQPFQFLTVCA